MFITYNDDMDEFRVDPNIQYDVVELPSKGIYYSTKKKSLRIAYLTAADENILAAPNLIATNAIVDELLRRKILDKDFNIEDLIEEDRQAILIFLRNTAFGSDYTITLKDPKTEEDFKVNVDLSTLKVKDFDLKPDANGEYSFFMEKSKCDITFQFLNQKQEKELTELQKNWNGNQIAPVMTKRLEMMIKSVKGSRDMMNIHNFVQNLPIKDSQDFRKYVSDKKPGLDLIQSVTAPSGEEVKFLIGFGAEFFRPFYGL